MRIRFWLLAVSAGLTLGLLGCGQSGPLEARQLSVPQNLRALAASEFTQYEFVAAEGYEMHSSDRRGWVDQDVEMVLRHKSKPFYIGVQYDRQAEKSTGRSTPWRLNMVGPTGEWGLDFRGTPDTRTAAFIDHFVSEYPDGGTVMQDSSLAIGTGSTQALQAWLTQRSDGVNGEGRETTFTYHPATESWTGR